MKKLIIKSACIAFAAAVLGAVIVFCGWLVCSPQTMADACERTGNYSFAVTCADLRFRYTKKTADLARCAEDGILSQKDGHIVKYCEKLVAREDFSALCLSRDEKLNIAYGYNDYIRGNLAAAQYRGGNFDKAVETASQGTPQSFVKLVIEVTDGGTEEQAHKLIDALKDCPDATAVNLTQILNRYISKGE